MSVVSSLKNIKFADVLAKTAGIAGLAYVAYDSHKAARVEATKVQKDMKSESIEDHYLSDMKLDSPSVVKSNIKKRITEFSLDENISSPFTAAAGYVKGFSSMLVNNVVPLGLSAGALIAPKGILSRLFGIGLVVYGGIFLAKEIFGVDKHSR